MPSVSVSRNLRVGRKRRAAAGPRRARGADAHRGRAFARAPARGPGVAGDQADRRSAAGIAVQHSRPCLRRSHHGCARARSLCRDRRARARGAVPRRGVCSVHRRGSGGPSAAARERGDLGVGRHHPHLSARCHQARGGASDRAVLRWLSSIRLTAAALPNRLSPRHEPVDGWRPARWWSWKRPRNPASPRPRDSTSSNGAVTTTARSSCCDTAPDALLLSPR